MQGHHFLAFVDDLPRAADSTGDFHGLRDPRKFTI